MIIFTVSIHTVTAMTRHFLLLLLLLPGAFRLSAKPLPKEYVRDSLPVLAERCRQLLETAYMADSLVGETDSLPGWEGLPVRLYEYRTGPDIRTGQPKKGKVYLLNPSPERLAAGSPPPAGKRAAASSTATPTNCCDGSAASRAASFPCGASSTRPCTSRDATIPMCSRTA